MTQQNDIGTELGKADAHVTAIKRNETCMKFLLFIVIVLLFATNVVAFIWKIFGGKKN